MKESEVKNGNIESISEWFKRAVPAPSDKSRCVQIGVHFEEVAEMLSALGGITSFESTILDELGTDLKQGHLTLEELEINRQELLDALCDQIVTAVGVAHMFGMDIAGALSEVDRSNWSKFLPDGTPVFDANGKIAKNLETYFKPDLTAFA